MIVVVTCSEEIKDIVKGLENAQKKIKNQTDLVAEYSEELDRLTTFASATGEGWDSKERAERKGKMKQLTSEKNKLVSMKEKLAQDLAKISDVEKVTWPPDGDTILAQPLGVGLTDGKIKKFTGKGEGEWKTSALLSITRLIDGAAVNAKLESSSPGKCATHSDNDLLAGLKYRVPVPGQLLLSSTQDGNADVGKASGLVAQGGCIFTLPLRSTAFSSKSIEAAFTESGLPTKLAVKSLSASAETAASTVDKSVGQIIKAREGKTKKKLQQVKDETELLKAQQEPALVKKGLEPPQSEEQAEATQAFTADTALANAELANIKARRAECRQRGAVKLKLSNKIVAPTCHGRTCG
ncbi:MAG: hypothetical protein EXR08_04955 [Alphaproteobacteria bacterium]|nr:hypothetical protein [Alphaproteobacteria bacterium]